MDDETSIELYRWIGDRFAPESPGSRQAVATMGPVLEALVAPGDRVLDLCCGGGTWSFFFDDLEASVTGIDVAGHMIDLAQREADRRGSNAEFLVGDVLRAHTGEQRFDLAVLMGNTIADIPPRRLSGLAAKVHRTLKPAGRLAVHYLDGVAYIEEERSPRKGVDQEGPPRISRQFEEYRPDDGAWVVTYTNEATGEHCDYTSYVYTAPLLRLVLAPYFDLERSHRPGEGRFLDIFARRGHSPDL